MILQATFKAINYFGKEEVRMTKVTDEICSIGVKNRRNKTGPKLTFQRTNV